MLKPQTAYYLMRGGVAFFYQMWLTVTLLYHTEVISQDPFRLVMLGVVHEATVFIFEIPTGVVADAYGRKRSILIGLTLTGIAWLLEGGLSFYATVFAAQILFGIGFTFYSGANDAWLADEIGHEQAGPIFVRGTQIGLLLGQLGILCAIAVGLAGLNWPIIVAGVGNLGMVLLLAQLMAEKGFQPEADAVGVWNQFRHTFDSSLTLLKRRGPFITVVIVGLIVGLSVGGYDRLFTPHFLLNFNPPLEPVVWFGLLSAVISLSSAFILEWVRRRAALISAEGIPRLIALLYAGSIIGNVIFVLAGRFGLALIAFWFSQMLRTTTRPLIIIWINQIAPSRVRASAISMYWQSNSLGQIIGGPFIGLLGRIYTLKSALMVSILALSPTLWFLTRGDDAKRENG